MAGSKDVQKKIETLITDAIKAVGYDVFNQSQVNVPVVTGKLKRSGDIRVGGHQFEIEYSAHYAQDVEFGRGQPRDFNPEHIEEQRPLQTTTVISPQHQRTIKRGKNRGRKYTVKRHTKTFDNYMVPIKVGENEFRTINSLSKTQGRHFLGDALEQVLGTHLSVTSGLEGKIKVGTIIAKD